MTNPMSNTVINNTTNLELKFCERCGALWLRPAGRDRRYCQKCKPRMDDLAGRSKRGRPPKKADGISNAPAAGFKGAAPQEQCSTHQQSEESWQA